MKNKGLKLPAIIIVIGIVATVIACLLTAIIKKPTVTEHDFDYSVTYTLNGETCTFADVYRCYYADENPRLNPTSRYYVGSSLKDDGSMHPGTFTIDEKDGLELRIVTIFSDDYLMGDSNGKYVINEIYLAAFDDMGSEYSDPETLGKFDVQIIDYQLPTPIENPLVFGGFSLLHDVSMLVMCAIGILVIIACMIGVKRDEGVVYQALDKISIVFNFINIFAFIPFVCFIVLLSGALFMSGDEVIYQIDLCIPVITTFTVAASLCLRRKGFTKSGFFIQFIGIALFLLNFVFEALV